MKILIPIEDSILRDSPNGFEITTDGAGGVTKSESFRALRRGAEGFFA